MDNDSKYVLRKIIIDFICLGIVALPILLFKLFGEPFKRGFFCNDESISHPYRDNTISTPFLNVIAFGFPITTILVTEFYLSRRGSTERRSKILAGITIPPWIWDCYKLIGVFCFGAACSHLTTDVAKYAIGRLRPHYMDICKPNVDCSLPENQHRYIENFECLGTNHHRIHDARLSFLSGHSSLSAYTMIFLAMYIYARWTWRGSKLLRHTVQFAGITFAWFTALSRVSDYKHHWSDVLAGSVQGTIVAILIVLFVSDLFPRNPKRNIETSSVLPMVQKEVSGVDGNEN